MVDSKIPKAISRNEHACHAFEEPCQIAFARKGGSLDAPEVAREFVRIRSGGGFDRFGARFDRKFESFFDRLANPGTLPRDMGGRILFRRAPANESGIQLGQNRYFFRDGTAFFRIDETAQNALDQGKVARDEQSAFEFPVVGCARNCSGRLCPLYSDKTIRSRSALTRERFEKLVTRKRLNSRKISNSECELT